MTIPHSTRRFTPMLLAALMLAALPATAMAQMNYNDSGLSYKRRACSSPQNPDPALGSVNLDHAWVYNEIRTETVMNTYWVALSSAVSETLLIHVEFTLPNANTHMNENITIQPRGTVGLQLGVLYYGKAYIPSPTPIVKANDIFKYIKITCLEKNGKKMLY